MWNPVNERDRECPASAPTAPDPLLEVHGLQVSFAWRGRVVHAVQDLSYQVLPGRTLAIIGESGSGKTVSCRALMGLLPPNASTEGSVCLDGQQVLGLGEPALRRLRGSVISMVFQDATRSLNPTMRVGQQIAEAIRLHEPMERGRALQCAADLLDLLRMPAARQRCSAYPHELSGGMRQRVLIAIAVAARPRVLIADEATSALDAITQADTLEMLGNLQKQFGMALIMVSHDLRLAMSFADDVIVMYAGRGVEYGPAERLASHPRMRYTRALLDAVRRLERSSHARFVPVRARGRLVIRAASVAPGPLLSVRDLEHEFGVQHPGRPGRIALRAVRGVSFDVDRGETLGLLGESGSGKSTLARAVLQEPRPTRGEVRFEGQDLTRLRWRKLLERRRSIQMIFQDPFASLNPRWTVASIVEEPLVGHRIGESRERKSRVAEALELVGLPLGTYGRRAPRELSGGQCQRVAIARALTSRPALLVCDEAVSSLDVLVQAQVLDLFEELRAELGLSYLFISHDLAIVKQVSDRVAVLHLGKICEIGPAESLYREARHPYTAALVDSVRRRRASPGAQEKPVVRLAGELPSPLCPPSGCSFRTRCPRAQELCVAKEPALEAASGNHLVACHFPLPTAASLAVCNSARTPAASEAPAL